MFAPASPVEHTTPWTGSTPLHLPTPKAFGVPAIVGMQDHERVVPEPLGFERLRQVADLVVQELKLYLGVVDHPMRGVDRSDVRDPLVLDGAWIGQCAIRAA